MKPIEKALRAELRALHVSLESSASARTAVDLARRLDDEPGDRSAVMLSRELRLLLADLRAQKGGGASDVEEFLRRVSTPAFDAGH